MSTPDLRLSWGGLKEFADGSLGSKTALFHEPYIQDPGEELTTGVRTIKKDVLKEQVQKADKAGLQVHPLAPPPPPLYFLAQDVPLQASPAYWA